MVSVWLLLGALPLVSAQFPSGTPPWGTGTPPWGTGTPPWGDGPPPWVTAMPGFPTASSNHTSTITSSRPSTMAAMPSSTSVGEQLATAASNPSSSSTSSSSLSGGVIAGIVVSVIAFVAILGALLFVLGRNRALTKKAVSDDEDGSRGSRTRDWARNAELPGTATESEMMDDDRALPAYHQSTPQMVHLKDSGEASYAHVAEMPGSMPPKEEPREMGTNTERLELDAEPKEATTDAGELTTTPPHSTSGTRISRENT